MILAIIVILLLLAIGFFHYLQGFFSATISAIISVLAAVLALSYQETIVEGPLSGIAPDWMPGIVLLLMFALIYVILRTVFDKMIPAGVQLPAIMDKIGGAAMGLVAGAFALGIVVIAAQQLPFGVTLGGYGRYETSSNRSAQVPTGAVGARPKEANTYDEMTSDKFDPGSATRLLVPLDDLVVGTVSHLSDGGSLASMGGEKPFTSIHPNYLQELFGQRLGIENGGWHTASNTDKKQMVDLVGVYELQRDFPQNMMVDAELSRIRGPAVKPPKLTNAERFVVVRVRLGKDTADTKDRRVRLALGGVRLVAKRNDVGAGGFEPHNYFPIGTLDVNGYLYLNKIDDPLVIDAAGKKAGGGESPAEVDFVFQVEGKGLIEGDPGDGKPLLKGNLENGTLFEFKKFARIDLGGKDVKPWASYLPTVTAVKRKHLEWEGPVKTDKGEVTKPKPPDAAKVAAPPTPEPTAAPAGGGEVAQRLAGTWVGRAGVAVEETLTFTADGHMTSETSTGTIQMRWAAIGKPEGDVITIGTAPGDGDPKSGDKRTITFTGDTQFETTAPSGKNARYSRQGEAPPPAEATPESAQPATPKPSAADVQARMVGQWESDAATGISYDFRADGNYSAKQEPVGGKAADSAQGKWTFSEMEADGKVAVINFEPEGKPPRPQRWDISGDKDELARIILKNGVSERIQFKRKS